jgi:hypothetical protein
LDDTAKAAIDTKFETELAALYQALGIDSSADDAWNQLIENLSGAGVAAASATEWLTRLGEVSEDRATRDTEIARQ